MTTLAPTESQLVDRIEEVGAKIKKVRESLTVEALPLIDEMVESSDCLFDR